MKKIVDIIFSTYITMLSLFLGYLVADFFFVPFRSEKVEIVAVAPDHVTYHSIFVRRRICQTDVDRLVVSDDDLKIFYRDSVPGRFNVGRHENTGTLKFDPPLLPGDYKLELATTSHCSLITRIDAQPSIRFHVE